MSGKHLKIREFDGCAVVTLRGELDLVAAAHVAATLIALADRHPRIVLDLTDLEFIDCRGVAALVSGRAKARQAGGDLLIAAPQRQVMKLLTRTAPAYGFFVYANAEEAISGFRELDTTLRLGISTMPA
jgi:anti-sigma B factor antagonist